MEELVEQVEALKEKPVAGKIESRLREFEAVWSMDSKRWFSELCFCLLTANSKAKTALEIEKQLGIEGFCTSSFDTLKDCIRDNKHRFHNNKARYICEARTHLDIKEKIISFVDDEGEVRARDWLANSVKGLGYKEASHFMRNVGYRDIGIVDRHIINLLVEHGMEKPLNISKGRYLEIEDRLRDIGEKVSMDLAKLDLYLWYLKTGEVLK